MFKMTVADDLCSSYDSISVTNLTVGTTDAVPDITTDFDASSCNPNNAFY